MKPQPLVLIIDDSPVNLMLLHNVLEKHNFRVVLAEHGEQGFRIAKESSPDIILLDVIMPGWDGYETCRRIKQDASLTQIPILFLSALGDTENKVRALQAGGVDYVSKPFQKEELLARVETHIELAHLRQNLEDEVANQTEKIQLLFEALQLSYDKAQQASMLKTEFLRNISHEFLTPMNIVLGMTEMLLEETELTEEQQHFTKSAMKAGKQLQDILTNMLNFAQIFKGEVKEIIIPFHICDVIDNILKRLSTTIEKKNLQISTEIAPALYTTFKGNQEGIYNVLNKLIENAIKFTTELGQLVIRVQPIDKPTQRDNIDRVQSSEKETKKYWVRFEISDTGIGIAEKKQAELFDIFSQVDSSTTRNYDGMGMGLAVAKLLTESMGGQIGVNSESGQGSTFWVNLPLEIMK